jgi:hypothetical protein
MRTLRIVVCLVFMLAATGWAHDLFLRPESLFVAPNSDVRVRVLTGDSFGTCGRDHDGARTGGTTRGLNCPKVLTPLFD